MAHVAQLGDAPTLIDLFKAYPGIGRHVLGFMEAAFTLSSELSRGECERVAAYVSALNQCSYCHTIHAHAAKVCGLDPDLLPEFQTTNDATDDRWKAAYGYARQITNRPAEVGEEHVRACRDAGWSNEAITQIAMVATGFNLMNRLVDSLGLTGDPEFLLGAGERLGTISYGGTAAKMGLN
ncbi:carboxymuconolactone decarboxylase family protein [Minwuia sp.]|uniref:carboxymuconolactone decarboxylase family protein n=1 Tax=Minwuia sp. TaxID=2493630 RepID=UPI003A8DEB77